MLEIGKIYKYENSTPYTFCRDKPTTGAGCYPDIKPDDFIFVFQIETEKQITEDQNGKSLTWHKYKILSLRSELEIGVIWCLDTYKETFDKTFTRIA